MEITYKINCSVKLEEFKQVLLNSSLAERRPIEDDECLTGMLKNSNLIVSAWRDNELVGIARSMTDFHYACYLSDLAVSKECQKMGVGLKLQQLTQEQLGPKCKLILLSAPTANEYYHKIGYQHHERCWVAERRVVLR